tara:strand:+ start:6233 stop:6799 length:567 start_codon:yes stop_codon:yes gene_type:complete
MDNPFTSKEATLEKGHSRIGNDSCYLDQQGIQNVQACNYTLQNYFLDECSMKKPIEFATQQPAVNYKGGYLGAGGCNIDENSQLLHGTIQTKPKAKVDLHERIFSTVPFLGRGSVNSVEESKLQQGERETNKRSVNKLSEKTYMNHSTTPLLDNISESVQDPKHIVEESAHPGWIRGGIASRDMTRDR